MQYFKKYVSNSLAGIQNQSAFNTDNKDCEYTGRAFFKIFKGGCFNYSFLFSNITDSTYRGITEPNDFCEQWTILDMGACILKSPENPTDINSFADIEIPEMQQVTFGGKEKRVVKPGELFTSDEVELCANDGDFLCIEMTFKGSKIPFHDEAIIPIFVYEDGKFLPNKRMPLPNMIGCERLVKKRIGFLGDSITQGIGATFNSYGHWAALIADALGREYSVWNLGIGCARAVDAATDGAWLFKAKQCDFVSVCLGVNDILNAIDAATIINSLEATVKALKSEGVRVGIFTPFPFAYKDEKLEVWNEVCRYIKDELSKKCEYCFVTSDYVGCPDEPQTPMYGGHPNDEGCKALADGFMRFISEKGFEF